MSIFGRISAGGRISACWLGSRALGIWAGWSDATWLIITCNAAAGSRPSGISKRQLAIMHAKAIFEAGYFLLDVPGLVLVVADTLDAKEGRRSSSLEVISALMGLSACLKWHEEYLFEFVFDRS